MHWFWRATIAIGITFVYGLLVVAWTPNRVIGPNWSTSLRTMLFWRLGVMSPVICLLTYGLMTLRYGPKRPDGETRCRKCGYILRGITEPRCPECGEKI